MHAFRQIVTRSFGVAWGAVAARVAMAFVGLAFIESAGHAEQATDGDSSEVAFLFAGMQSERAKLHSGVFRVTEAKHSSSFPETPQWSWQGTFSLFCAFDKNCFRFDRTATRQFSKSGSVVGASGMEKTQGERVEKDDTKFIRCPTRSCVWRVGSNSIMIALPDVPAPTQLAPFDARALGLYDWLEMSRGKAADKLIVEYLALKPNISIERVGDHVIRLVVRHAHSKSRWIISVDVEHGFTPFLAETHEPKSAHAAIFPDDWRVSQEYHTAWEQRTDVWIPVHHHLRVTDNGGGVKTVDMDLKWEHVNEPVDAGLFDHASFDAPGNVTVLDSTTGKLIAVSGPDQEKEIDGKTGPLLIWWIASLLLFLVFITAYRVVRRARGVDSPGT